MAASELLTSALDPAVAPVPHEPLQWTSRDLGTPRVDLEDREAVRALLDEPT